MTALSSSEYFFLDGQFFGASAIKYCLNRGSCLGRKYCLNSGSCLGGQILSGALVELHGNGNSYDCKSPRVNIGYVQKSHRKWLRTNGPVVDRSTFVSGDLGFDCWLDGRSSLISYKMGEF